MVSARRGWRRRDADPRPAGRSTLRHGRRLRAASELPHLDEIQRLIDKRQGRLYTLLGSRDEVQIEEVLVRIAPDLAHRDIYVCGPGGFTDAVVETARLYGAENEQIHREAFAF